MGLLRFSYRSEILSLHTNITVTLPSEELTYYPLTDIKREEGVAARRKWEYRDGMKFQTVYLLHGGGDDDTCVVRKSNIERYAEENCVPFLCDLRREYQKGNRQDQRIFW